MAFIHKNIPVSSKVNGPCTQRGSCTYRPPSLAPLPRPTRAGRTRPIDLSHEIYSISTGIITQMQSDGLVFLRNRVAILSTWVAVNLSRVMQLHPWVEGSLVDMPTGLFWWLIKAAVCDAVIVPTTWFGPSLDGDASNTHILNHAYV